MDFLFVLTSIGLGVALAMDAFSVSLVNGLANPNMKFPGIGIIAGTFAFFQFAMPMIGWVCVYYFTKAFRRFEPLIPYIALALLLFLGVKMILDGCKGEEKEGEENNEAIGKMQNANGIVFSALLLQGIATSIDALSSGFTFVGSGYGPIEAFIASLIIAAVTFAICAAGVVLGKKCGTLLAGKATVFGGVILIVIGLEIFIKGVFFA